MNRRSTPQAQTDDAAFPIRVKVAVPPNGLGRVANETHDWLRANIDSWDYANHSVRALAGHATAFYFRDIEVAQQFIHAFPQAQLADGTLSPAYARNGVKRSVED